MSIAESVKAEFHKSPLLAASAVAAVVGAAVLVTRHGTAGSPLTSPLDSARNPQANLAGGGGNSGGGGGAGLGQGDPAIGVPTSNVPVQQGTSNAPILSASDVAAAINQAVAGLSGSISDSQSQLQGEINQLAGAISRSQSVNEAPRTPVAPDSGQVAGLLQQILNRVSQVAPATQIAAPTPTATPQITAAPRTLAIDGQSLFSQSPQTIADFQAAFGGGAAQAWVQQHEQELLHPRTPVLSAFSETPAPLAPRPPSGIADPTGGLIANPIPGVNYAPEGFRIAQPTVVFGAPLPQPLNPIPGVDYGPLQAPAPPPPGLSAGAARVAAQQAANPSNIAHIQPQVPRSVDTQTQPAPATRTRVVLV